MESKKKFRIKNDDNLSYLEKSSKNVGNVA